MSDYIDTTFEFEGNTFPLRILTGVVIDTETRSDTHVSSGVDNLAVSSYVKVTKDIWLRSASGKEHRFQFGDLAIRPGHVLQITSHYDNWLKLDNLTTDKGWNQSYQWNASTATDRKIIPLIAHRSSTALFYLVKCSFIAAMLTFLLGKPVLIVLIYPVVVFFASIYRMLPSSQINLNEQFKKAAIAVYDQMKTQRAEAVEYLKLSLSESEIATISGSA